MGPFIQGKYENGNYSESIINDLFIKENLSWKKLIPCSKIAMSLTGFSHSSENRANKNNEFKFE